MSGRRNPLKPSFTVLLSASLVFISVGIFLKFDIATALILVGIATLFFTLLVAMEL